MSVSLSTEDVEFLDYYVTEHDLKTRSAALQQALRALRDIDLGDQYETAWDEVHSEDPAVLAAWREQYESWQAEQHDKSHPDRVTAFRRRKAEREAPRDATR